MRIYAILVAIATILMVGGCQNTRFTFVADFNGTSGSSTNNPQTNDDPVQEIGTRGYRFGTYDRSKRGGGSHSLGIDETTYDQVSIDYGVDYVGVYGPALVSLPLGTMTYGGEDTSDFVMFQLNPDNLQSRNYTAQGYVEIDVNFAESKLIRFDVIATRPHEALNLEHEKIVELRDSDEITVDPSTGKFGGTSTLSVTQVRGSVLERELVDGSPHKLTVKGYFHGEAKNSRLSGVFYNDKAVGALIAECTICK